MARRNRRPDERWRTLWLQQHELERLLRLIPHDEDTGLVRRLKQLAIDFEDDALLLKELVARTKANGFWVRESYHEKRKRVQGEARNERKRQLRECAEGIAHLAAEAVAALERGEELKDGQSVAGQLSALQPAAVTDRQAGINERIETGPASNVGETTEAADDGEGGQ